MRTHTHLLALALVLALVPAVRSPARAAGALPASLCATGETVLFSCALTGPKARTADMVSVCGLPETSVARVQVRRGAPAGKQTVVPEATVPSEQALTYSRYTRPQTTYLSLTYNLSGVDYTLYDEESMGQVARGLRVQKPGGAMEDKPCQGTVTGSLMQAEDLLPTAP